MAKYDFVVFHHNDLDGYGSAAVVASSLIYARKVATYEDITFIVCNYNDKNPTKARLLDATGGIYPREVYVVDVSLKSIEEIEELYDMMENGSKVFWFDHHEASRLLLSEMRKQSDPVDFVAERAYRRHTEYVRDNMLVMDVNMRYCATWICWIHLLADFCEGYRPQIVGIINDWDLWIHETDKSKFINNAFFAEPDPDEDDTSLKNPCSITWARILGVYLNKEEDVETLQQMYDGGLAIARYKEQTYKNWFRTYGYVTEFESYECVCMNWKINSEVFSDWYDQYPLHLIWCFDGEKYHYSIYTDSKKTGIDCNAIAAKYGGGGHKGAAGFITDKLVVPYGEKAYVK